MDRIGVVGAGVAGAGVAVSLERAAVDVEVAVFERASAVGGRAASRTRDDVVYDHGANYVKADDERVARLLTEDLDTAGLVDVTEPVYTFDASGTVSPGRDADDHKWTYESGLRELARRLLAGTAADVHLETPIEGLSRRSPGWMLEDDDADAWGPFDAVVLTPPAPVTADLLAGADWNSDIRGRLVAALRDVPYRAIYSAALHYPFAIERPYYALVNTDRAHAVSWLSREECKPGHVPDGETLLIVQASHDWTVAHADDPPGENATHLAEHAADIVGDDRLATPDWTDHRHWRHALVDGEVPSRALHGARADGLHLAGDAVAGVGRIHAALWTGLEVGDTLAAEACCQSQPNSSRNRS